MADLMSELERFEAEMKELAAESPSEPQTVAPRKNLATIVAPPSSSHHQSVPQLRPVPIPISPGNNIAQGSIPAQQHQQHHHHPAFHPTTHSGVPRLPPPPPPSTWPSVAPSPASSSRPFPPPPHAYPQAPYNSMAPNPPQYHQQPFNGSSHSGFPPSAFPPSPANFAQHHMNPPPPHAASASSSSLPQALAPTQQTQQMSLTAQLQKHEKDQKMAQKKKVVPRVAAGQKWKDATLADFPENDHRLFCGDLGNEVNDEVLGKSFAKYPSFQMARVIRDKRTGKTKGYGFVSFGTLVDSVTALKEMNGKYVGNRPVKLRKSSWQERLDQDALKKQKKGKKQKVLHG